MRKFPKLLHIVTTSLLPIITLYFASPSYAANTKADFEVNNRYIIEYSPENSYVSISETLTIKANNSSYYLPAQGEQKFTLPDFSLQKDQEERAYKIASIKLLDKKGKEKSFRIEENEDGIDIFTPDSQDITISKPFELTLTYQTHQLINKNGNITNLYIPGLPADTQFESVDSRFGIVTKYSYDTQFILPSTAPEASYINPSSVTVEKTPENTTYRVDQKDRLGTSAWIQLGTEQYYYFRIVQKAPKTDSLVPPQLSQYSDLLSTNVYRLPLPKEQEENNQKVYFKNITPKPKQITKDREGNLYAYFDLPANQESEIVVEGYISLTNSLAESSEIPDIALDKYISEIKNDPNFRGYTIADRYWEADSNRVKQISTELIQGQGTLLEYIDAVYSYLINEFDYSYEKVEGENLRLGALEALEGGPTVCMEYADAAIALLRAQGIPARAAVGYGNDPIGTENLIGVEKAEIQKVGHQWLQVWVPDYGWLSVDPTWGESGRRYIGSNLDHILVYTMGRSDENTLGTSINSADNVSNLQLDTYDMYLQALSEDQFPQKEELQSLSNLLTSYDDIEYDGISFFLKTSSFGKSIVIITPVCLTFLLFMTLLSALVTLGKKRAQYRNKNETRKS